jgi:Elongation factor P (EF-P) KOW-like domain
MTNYFAIAALPVFACAFFLTARPANAFVVSPSIHCPSPPAFYRLHPLGVAIDTSDIKNGLTVEIDGEPYKVLSFSIMKQARGAAKTTIKFKNLMRGNTLENTYRSGEKFETAMIEKKNAQFTYQDGVSATSWSAMPRNFRRPHDANGIRKGTGRKTTRPRFGRDLVRTSLISVHVLIVDRTRSSSWIRQPSKRSP